MPKSDCPKTETDKTYDEPKHFFSVGFWLVLLLGVGLIGFVAYVSFRSREPIDSHWAFFVGSLINALMFAAIVFQAFIYSKQWDTQVRVKYRDGFKNFDSSDYAFRHEMGKWIPWPVWTSDEKQARIDEEISRYPQSTN